MANVRPATARDGDAVGRVQVESWRAAYAGLLPEEAVAGFDIEARQRLWREWLAETPATRFGGPASELFVAELDGDVVGFANVGEARDEAREGELYAIYVDPSCWGRGVGRALIERAEEALRAAGFREAILWVLEGNARAERFYGSAGWTEDGRKADEFQGAEVVELRYRKSLV
jgi:GNAT superfamily N-acetyltransferase